MEKKTLRQRLIDDGAEDIQSMIYALEDGDYLWEALPS